MGVEIGDGASLKLPFPIKLPLLEANPLTLWLPGNHASYALGTCPSGKPPPLGGQLTGTTWLLPEEEAYVGQSPLACCGPQRNQKEGGGGAEA